MESSCCWLADALEAEIDFYADTLARWLGAQVPTRASEAAGLVLADFIAWLRADDDGAGTRARLLLRGSGASHLAQASLLEALAQQGLLEERARRAEVVRLLALFIDGPRAIGPAFAQGAPNARQPAPEGPTTAWRGRNGP